MISPPPLVKGDTIGIVSTARKISLTELQPAIAILNKWGFNVKLSRNLFDSFHQFSGTDEQRAEDLQSFIDDPEIKAILCAKGGYGTVRIIDKIDFTSLLKSPKWVAAYSDPTVLLNHLFNIGIESLHAPMPVGFASNTKASLESLKNAFTGSPLEVNFKSHPLNRPGNASGKLIGGNLSILFSLLGSKSSINTKNCILFLEDLDEYLYHVDRMMMNLKRNGYLNSISALIVGGMSDMNDNKVPFGNSAEQIISECVADFDFPVCFGFPAGHIDDNRTLIFGREAELIVGDQNYFTQ